MRLSFNEAARALGLDAHADGVALTHAVTDSREAGPGALFVCIPGEHVDGHAYVAQARERGAAAVLASRDLRDVGLPVLRVPDTVKALGRLAACWRDQTSARVVGVTGTAGKTTLKEVLAQTLGECGTTFKNPLNNNNQVGMPRAMLAASGGERFWVMEAGISHAGDMEELGAILRPDVGVILNVGAGHTEGLGDKGVAWHKSRLLERLATGGVGVVCADYPALAREARAVGAPLRWFSAQDPDTEFFAAYRGPSADGSRGVYRLQCGGWSAEVAAPFRGAYGAENVAAVGAVAQILGLSPAQVARGLAKAVLPDQRCREQRVGGWLCLDDTYNANPLSMRRMLDAAAERAGRLPLAVVLGEMLELGAQAEAEHHALGRHLAELAPAAVFWKGGMAEAVRAGLADGGYAGPWRHVADAASFAAAWVDLAAAGPLAHGGVALFKGSRGNRMESLLSALGSGGT